MERGRNVLVTGTPGVGKTTFCENLAERSVLEHVDVSRLVKEEELYLEWDDELNCSVFDEDRVVEALEPKLEGGGCLIDFHSCSFLPSHLFDLVVVLRTNNTVLYDRLKARGYSAAKITENVECEIFQMVLDEAEDTFQDSGVKVMELANDEIGQLDSNVDTVASVIKELRK